VTAKLKLALLTCEEFPDLTVDDQILFNKFQESGISVQPLIWSQDRDEEFDAILFRSPWDYQLRLSEYLQWQTGRAKTTRFLNDIKWIEWNIHKSYLVRLADLGVSVVSTQEFKKGSSVELGRHLELSAVNIVVKPAISASAYETRVISAPVSIEELNWAKNLVRKMDVLVQPFLSAIQERGELSLVSFDGELSHVVLKTPKAGDFRVQREFGGRYESVDIQEWHREMNDTYLRAAIRDSKQSSTPLYARVDLVPLALSQGWQLGEIELFEPSLYFQYEASAAATLVRAIRETLS
jgi:hypothetical protein